MKAFLEGAAAVGVETATVFLRGLRFQSCIRCERCRRENCCEGLQDEFQIVYPKLLAAKGLVLVSPTHNYNITAWMKAFIDRLYCFYGYPAVRSEGWWSVLAGQGRKAVLGVIGEQAVAEETIGLSMEAMSLPIIALGYKMLAELPVTGLFEKGKIAGAADKLTEAQRLGQALARALLTV